MRSSTESLFLYRHGAVDSTVLGRQGSRRDTFFRYVHKHLPNGARIGRLGFPEQALVYHCLDDPIRHLGAGQDEAAALALPAAALALGGGGGDRFPVSRSVGRQTRTVRERTGHPTPLFGTANTRWIRMGVF